MKKKFNPNSIKMIDQTVTLKSPIKIMSSENYSLVLKDADGITHYWHKEHTAIIEDKEVEFKEGQYDGWSKDIMRPIKEAIKS